ncbi:MAG TPA: MarR family winged helix-turn-helix transcriptional regulator [Tepiditoga sp.]|nr:MarR family winged helix-turn-helix transcriptional regulator [Tepiditoga sp.]
MDMVTAGRFIVAINKNLESLFRKKIENLDFNCSYLEYLLVISSFDGINQKDIAKKTIVGKASVSKVVKYFTENDLAYMKKDTNDSRIKYVYITEKGKKISDEFKKTFIELNSLLIKDFSEEDYSVFKHLLEKALKNSCPDNKELITEELNFLMKTQ